MATPESNLPQPSGNNPGNTPKKPIKSGPPSFKGDQNRGPAQKIDRNRTIKGAPKTGRTPKR
ncbi:MAG: hypothetical protein H7210_14440 [Pyrinomonadaceae bacterium]|nr:hypothetical protein [Phycisphaerales bacterium]